MKPLLRNQSGFTLIELILGLALTSILLAALLNLFFVSLSAWLSGRDKMEAQQTARIAMDAMTREIRSDALSIAVPAGNGPSEILAIIVANKDVPGKLDTIVFQRTANTLYRKLNRWDGVQQSFPITEATVTELTFRVTQPRLVEISLGITLNQAQPFSLKSAIAGLNIP